MRDSQEALEVFERLLGDDSGRASALCSIGMAHTRLADYQQGRRYHRESLGLRRAMGDTVGEGASLNNLGVIHFSWPTIPPRSSTTWPASRSGSGWSTGTARDTR